MKNILLIVTGSIAAYKAPSLCNKLQQHGYCVRVILTQAASEIITPLALKSVCNEHVYLQHETHRVDQPMLHIDLAKWADIMLFAPASAHLCSRLAYGLADDLITSCYLATSATIIIAPAMNIHMWQHAAIEQIALLRSRDTHHILGPGTGKQACGDTGVGCMLDIDSIAAFITQQIKPDKILHGRRIMLNAGPTHEYIDCMRILTNRSSGKMGYALAQAAQQLGAEVTLISGPCDLPTPSGVKRIDVISALEMLATCQAQAPHHDIFIASAAIADYRPQHSTPHKKLKKSNSDTYNLELIKNPDVVATLAQKFPNLTCIGFAAESDDMLQHAQAKLQHKRLAAIIANPVSDTQGPNQDHATVSIISHNKITQLPYTDKATLAYQMLQELHAIELLATNYANASQNRLTNKNQAPTTT